VVEFFGGNREESVTKNKFLKNHIEDAGMDCLAILREKGRVQAIASALGACGMELIREARVQLEKERRFLMLPGHHRDQCFTTLGPLQ